MRCVASGKVRYTHKPDFLLTLPVPMDKATNRGELQFFLPLCAYFVFSTAEVEAWEAKKQQLQAEKKKMFAPFPFIFVYILL